MPDPLQIPLNTILNTPPGGDEIECLFGGGEDIDLPPRTKYMKLAIRLAPGMQQRATRMGDRLAFLQTGASLSGAYITVARTGTRFNYNRGPNHHLSSNLRTIGYMDRRSYAKIMHDLTPAEHSRPPFVSRGYTRRVELFVIGEYSRGNFNVGGRSIRI